MNNEIKDKIASLEIRSQNSKDSKCKIYLYKDLNPLHYEIAIHPNFNKNSSHGNSNEEIFYNLKNIEQQYIIKQISKIFK